MMYGLLPAQCLARSQWSKPSWCSLWPTGHLLWVAWTCGQGAGMDPGPHSCRHCLGLFFAQDHEHVGLPTLGLGEFLLPAMSSCYPISHTGWLCCEL